MCLHLTAQHQNTWGKKKKKIETKGEIDKSTIIFGDFNTPLLMIDRSRGQKISKYIDDLNSIFTINQLALIDIYRILHPTRAEYTYFWRLYETFTNIDYNLGHEIHLNKFKRMEIIQSMFLVYNEVILEINKKCSWKIHKYLEVKQHTFKEQLSQIRSLKRHFKNILNEIWKYNFLKFVEWEEISAYRGIYSFKCIY